MQKIIQSHTKMITAEIQSIEDSLLTLQYLDKYGVIDELTRLQKVSETLKDFLYFTLEDLRYDASKDDIDNGVDGSWLRSILDGIDEWEVD
tara:strand:- start:92 stop:364 length:273 start_codon:yes stop_codon:yes gene_type:complete